MCKWQRLWQQSVRSQRIAPPVTHGRCSCPPRGRASFRGKRCRRWAEANAETLSWVAGTTPAADPSWTAPEAPDCHGVCFPASSHLCSKGVSPRVPRWNLPPERPQEPARPFWLFLNVALPISVWSLEWKTFLAKTSNRSPCQTAWGSAQTQPWSHP